MAAESAVFTIADSAFGRRLSAYAKLTSMGELILHPLHGEKRLRASRYL